MRMCAQVKPYVRRLQVMYVGACPETLIQILYVVFFFGLFHMFCFFLESIHMLIRVGTSASHACLLSHARLGFSSYTMPFIHMPIHQCHRCCVAKR